MNAAGFAGAFEAIFRSVEDVCSPLTETEWELPTSCPGWTVKDHLSHLVDGTALFLARPRPEHEIPGDLAYVKNDAAAWMEIGVDYRRALPGADVLDEFRLLGAEMLHQLRGFEESDLDEEMEGPMGYRMPRRAFLDISVVDRWMHEQDIRRAIDQPGHLTGAAVEHARNRIFAAVEARAAESVKDAFEIELTRPERVLRLIGEGDPAVRLSMDLETFVALGGGRCDPVEQLVTGAVEAEGSQEVARHVLEAMAFTP